jgi:creatinine amidohydrolase
MIDNQLTSDQIASARPKIAVFGIGAIEQHGHHLPVATDWITVSEISRRVAEALNAFLIPAIPFSMSECHGPMKGTVWIKPATLSAVLQDVAASVHAQGIERLLVLNGHGGNFVLEPTIQHLNQTYPDLLVLMIVMMFGREVDHDGEPIFETGHLGIHAGEAETSTELYLNGPNVGDDRVDYVPGVGREFLDYLFMNKISPDGVWGHSSLGNADKGKRAVEAQVQSILAFVETALAALEDKEMK